MDPTKVNSERMKWQLINTLVPILLIVALGFVMAGLRKVRYSKKNISEKNIEHNEKE